MVAPVAVLSQLKYEVHTVYLTNLVPLGVTMFCMMSDMFILLMMS